VPQRRLKNRLFALGLDDRRIRQQDGIKYLFCPDALEPDEPEPERLNTKFDVGDL
jgi:hypothetical protein